MKWLEGVLKMTFFSSFRFKAAVSNFAYCQSKLHPTGTFEKSYKMIFTKLNVIL